MVLLGDPTTCPHGNPIPGAAQTPSTAGQMPLTEATPGSTVRLERISEQIELDMSALAYLDEHGFTPGATAVVTSRGPDGTVLLELPTSSVAFGPDLSSHLYVVAA